MHGSDLFSGNPIMSPNAHAILPPMTDPSIEMAWKTMRFEHPIAEVLYREGAPGVQSWLRDQMPVEVMVPYPTPKRRWIRSTRQNEQAGTE
jgi:hypothetical protein